MKTLLMIIAIASLAGAAQAGTTTACYGWEDGGTSLGEFGGVAYFVSNAYASEGVASLAVKETASGTGQIYAAWVFGLNEGDQVTASFDVYDDTAGTIYPSTRIWGHYTLWGDPNSYNGSAGGNSTYSDGLGWNNLDMTWVMPAGQNCLMVEIRPYGATATYLEELYNYVDNLCITIPDYATINFPGGVVGVTETSFGAVKALFR